MQLNSFLGSELLTFFLKHSDSLAVIFDGAAILGDSAFLTVISFLVAELFIDSLFIGDVPLSFKSC